MCPIGRSASTSPACTATWRTSSSIRPSTWNMRSSFAPATAGASPAPSGTGPPAMVRAPDGRGAQRPAVDGAPREQQRARYPDTTGFVERDGVRSFYEVYGAGEPTVLLMPTWSIIHSRHWKLQIPYLARHWRVVTFDGRGNGRSDRPPDP